VKLTAAGFHNIWEGASQLQRVTHPGNGPYPDATFDYLFGFNLAIARPQIVPSKASDHYPVTCEFSLGSAIVQPTPVIVSKQPTTVTPPPATPQFVTLTQPVRIKIRYGETLLPRGLKLQVLARNEQTVTVKYLDETLTIPVSSIPSP